jgi:hypothetical protein
MKTKLFALLGATVVLITGCVVTSVYPFYTEKDIAFDPALLGTFVEPGAASTNCWVFERGKGNSYLVTLREDEKTRAGQAHLFKLGGQVFLDFVTSEPIPDIEPEPLPTHILMRVSQVTPTLKMSSMKYDWLKDMLAQHPKAVRHIVIRTGESSTDQRIVLTADTAELQNFVLKHLNTEEAWNEDSDEQGLARITPEAKAHQSTAR